MTAYNIYHSKVNLTRFGCKSILCSIACPRGSLLKFNGLLYYAGVTLVYLNHIEYNR